MRRLDGEQNSVLAEAARSPLLAQDDSCREVSAAWPPRHPVRLDNERSRDGRLVQMWEWGQLQSEASTGKRVCLSCSLWEVGRSRVKPGRRRQESQDLYGTESEV